MTRLTARSNAYLEMFMLYPGFCMSSNYTVYDTVSVERTLNSGFLSAVPQKWLSEEEVTWRNPLINPKKLLSAPFAGLTYRDFGRCQLQSKASFEYGVLPERMLDVNLSKTYNGRISLLTNNSLTIWSEDKNRRIFSAWQFEGLYEEFLPSAHMPPPSQRLAFPLSKFSNGLFVISKSVILHMQKNGNVYWYYNSGGHDV